jgi:hypothetical protein
MVRGDDKPVVPDRPRGPGPIEQSHRNTTCAEMLFAHFERSLPLGRLDHIGRTLETRRCAGPPRTTQCAMRK